MRILQEIGESVKSMCDFIFFFNDTATTEIYTLSLHDALPICEIIRVLIAHQHDAHRMADEQMIGQLGVVKAAEPDRKSTRLNSSHTDISRMPSSA